MAGRATATSSRTRHGGAPALGGPVVDPLPHHQVVDLVELGVQQPLREAAVDAVFAPQLDRPGSTKEASAQSGLAGQRYIYQASQHALVSGTAADLFAVPPDTAYSAHSLRRFLRKELAARGRRLAGIREALSVLPSQAVSAAHDHIRRADKGPSAVEGTSQRP